MLAKSSASADDCGRWGRLDEGVGARGDVDDLGDNGNSVASGQRFRASLTGGKVQDTQPVPWEHRSESWLPAMNTTCNFGWRSTTAASKHPHLLPP